MTSDLAPYRRFEGDLSTLPRFWVMLEESLRSALRAPWALTALALSLTWGLGSIIEFQGLREAGGTSEHDGIGFLALLGQLPWFALGVAAAIGGPALAEDKRSGALELYLSRSVGRAEYLGAKALTAFLLTTLSILLPASAYWASSFIFYDTHPAWWGMALLGTAGIALLWGAAASGLALGLSAISRSPAAPALVLLGLFAAIDYIVDPLAFVQRMSPLTALTDDPRSAAVSPFEWLNAQQSAFLGLDQPPPFPAWWGLLGLASLAVLGWGLVLWRGPRPKGDEPDA